MIYADLDMFSHYFQRFIMDNEDIRYAPAFPDLLISHNGREILSINHTPGNTLFDFQYVGGEHRFFNLETQFGIRVEKRILVEDIT